MDTSAEVAALTSDAGSDNLVPAVSDSAEGQRSSVIGCSADVRLLENGEVVSESVSDASVTDSYVDNCCVKSDISGSSMCEKSAVKSAEDAIITDSHVVDRDDSTNVNQACGTNVTVDGTKDDSDTENADSRSQTPLQDELEPDADDLNQNQAITDSNMHDFTEKITADNTETSVSAMTAEQQCREENGEVSGDDDDYNDHDDDNECAVGNPVNANPVSQQAPGHADLLEKEKPTKELEVQKVLCLNVELLV